MAEADIFRVIRRQREAIEQSEKEMLEKLTVNWAPVHRFLEQQIEDLLAKIAEQQAKGETIWIGYIHSLERYTNMMREAEQAVGQYTAAIADIISGAEADATAAGQDNAYDLLDILDPSSPAWVHINQRETRIMTGMLTDGSPLKRLLEESWPQMHDKLESVLLTGISSGQGAAWIALRMAEAVDIPLRRAFLIARTEVNRAYREANREAMRSSDVIIGYRRMCYPPTACFACLMMDGDFYGKDEPFSDHPNGKCSLVPVTRQFDPINSSAWERGQEWFANQDAETQRSIMGAGRYDLWMKDGIDPRDMVHIKDNPVWGGSPTTYSETHLREKFGIPKK